MLRFLRWLVGGAALLVALPIAAQDVDLAGQREEQRRIQEETDLTVRRLETLLRVMRFYRVEGEQHEAVLREMTATLGGLSKNQMNAVLKHLTTAAVTPDANKSAEEVDAAYTRHREIITILNGLLARHEAIRNLDQLADRFDDLAKEQFELQERTGELRQFHSDYYSGKTESTSSKSTRAKLLGVRLVGDQQMDLYVKSKNLANLGNTLEPLLSEAPRTRLRKFQVGSIPVLTDMQTSYEKLRATGYPETRLKAYAAGHELQSRAVVGLKELAQMLREPTHKLATLERVRAELDRIIQDQETVARETKDPAPTKKPAEAEKQQRDLTENQGKLAFDTLSARQPLTPHAPELAEKLKEGESAMRAAQDQIRARENDKAEPEQKTALAKLDEVRKKLDEMITKERQAQSDPVVAMKNALDQVEKLIGEQKDLKAKTAAATSEKLEPLGIPQKELAARTDDLAYRPLPNLKTHQALDQAAKAMDRAAKALDAKKGEPAGKKQDEAIASLEKAKKELAEEIAQAEMRRDQLAKLDEAAAKLAELEKKEGEVVKAAEKSDAARAAEVGEKQAKLTPPTKEVAQMLKDTAPDAAKKADDAAKAMQAAQKNLTEKQPAAGAKNAAVAKRNLAEAQKAVAKAMEDLKAQEVAAQAAMQPKTDLAAAAQQLQQAIDQTDKAAQKAQMAALPQTPMPAAKNLAQMQKDIADEAKAQMLKEAGEAAEKAAAALEKGDLPQALAKQQEALAKLTDAKTGSPLATSPMASPMPGEAKPGMAKEPPAQAKGNAPTKAEPKKGAAKPGQPTASEPKAGEPKAGEPTTAQAKAGETPKGAATVKAGPSNASGQPAPKARTGAPASPTASKTPPQLAKAQKDLMEATKALAQSQQANQAAMAALAQAQAAAPQALQMPLSQGAKSLAQASQALKKSQPAPAQAAQKQAKTQMQAALNALQKAMAAGSPMPPQTAKAGPMGPPSGEGMGEGEGQGMGEGQQPGPGAKPGKGPGTKPGPGQEKNDAQGEGDRQADGKVTNAASKLLDVQGDGTFLHLQTRQRELIRQSLAGVLPPEFAPLIQQYYINLSRGRAATTPGTAVPSATPR